MNMSEDELLAYGKKYMESVGAVSYTHLDVYKRQGKRGATYTEEEAQMIANSIASQHLTYQKAEEIFGIGSGMSANMNLTFDIALPVSYTHLDVYKRQGVRRIIMDSLYLIIFFILGTVLGGFYTVLGGLLAAVSYTHLDVYKRQFNRLAKRNFIMEYWTYCVNNYCIEK